MVGFTFPDLDGKHHFWQICTKKSQNYQIQLKFGTKTSSNMENSMVVFTFSVLDGKDTFLANLVQKIKIVIFSWDLTQALIRLWWCSVFEF